MPIKSFFIVKIAQIIINNISGDLRKIIEDSVLRLEEKAKATKTPWDDMFVALLKMLIGI